MELRKDRDKALFAAYNKAIATINFSSQVEAVDYVRTHEAPRFYISPEFCSIVIGRMIRGEDPGIKGTLRIKKFEELYARYITESSKPENKNMAAREICNIIVEQKAPEFYLNYRASAGIINKQKEKRIKELTCGWID